MGWRTGLIQQLFCVLLVSQWMVHCHSSNECAVHTHHSNTIIIEKVNPHSFKKEMQGLHLFEQFGKLHKDLTLTQAHKFTHTHTRTRTRTRTHTRTRTRTRTRTHTHTHTLQRQSLSSRMFLAARSRWMKPFFER